MLHRQIESGKRHYDLLRGMGCRSTALARAIMRNGSGRPALELPCLILLLPRWTNHTTATPDPAP